MDFQDRDDSCRTAAGLRRGLTAFCRTATLFRKKEILMRKTVFLAIALLLGLFFAAAPAPASSVKSYVGDSAITTAVKAKFLAQKGLDSLDLKVKTDKGIVTLRGQVHTPAQAKLAEKTAYEVDGVRGVTNKISVMP
jgi:hypothetical protein